MNDFIEQQIVEAVRGLLCGAVNELLRNSEYDIPVIDFGEYGCGYATVPVISIVSNECTEKERIIRLDTYLVTITLIVPETGESELYCYAYSGAIGRAIYDDPTLGGVVDRAFITSKKYISPPKHNCGEEWGLIITVRVTVEEINNAG